MVSKHLIKILVCEYTYKVEYWNDGEASDCYWFQGRVFF